jgi:hypothetical protein
MAIRGWVYVLTTKSTPNLLKVGFSLKDPVLRANELENAGLPYPYVVDYEALVYEPLEIEQRVHKELKDFREAKEWFRCSLADAIDTIRKVIGEGNILLETVNGDVKYPEGKKARFSNFIINYNGTVLDKKTHLLWAASDSNRDIKWQDAEGYCEHCRIGGYTDWRMPTLNELASLYGRNGGEITISSLCLWSSEKRGPEVAYFNFDRGYSCWTNLTHSFNTRILPVRFEK